MLPVRRPLGRVAAACLGPAARRHGYASRVRTTEVATGFDATWRTLDGAQRAQLAKEYAAYEAQDWHQLTLEQKRASTGAEEGFGRV